MRGAVWLLVPLALALGASGAQVGSRFLVSRDEPARRRGDGFDRDVLNRFLEQYANQVRRSTERPRPSLEDDAQLQQEGQDLEAPILGPAKNTTDAFPEELVSVNGVFVGRKGEGGGGDLDGWELRGWEGFGFWGTMGGMLR